MGTIGKVQGIIREFTFEWQIEDFLSLPEEDGKSYISPFFSFVGEPWQLRIHPNGESENNSVGHVGVYLYRNRPSPPITLALFLGIKTVDGTKNNQTQIICVFDEENIGYGTSKLLKRSTLLEKESKLVPSDVLTIVCNVDYYFRTSDERGNTIIAEYKKLLVGESASSHEQKCLDKLIRCPVCSNHVCERATVKDDYLKCCKMKFSSKDETSSSSEACSYAHRKHKKHSSKRRCHSHSRSGSDSEYTCCKHQSRRIKKHKSRSMSSSSSKSRSTCSDVDDYLSHLRTEYSREDESRSASLPIIDKMVSQDPQLSNSLFKLEGEGLILPLVTDVGLNLRNLLLVLPLPATILRDTSPQSLLSHLENSEEAYRFLNLEETICITSLLDALDFTTTELIEVKEENSEVGWHSGVISPLLNCLVQKNPVVFINSICDGVPPSYMDLS